MIDLNIAKPKYVKRINILSDTGWSEYEVQFIVSDNMNGMACLKERKNRLVLFEGEFNRLKSQNVKVVSEQFLLDLYNSQFNKKNLNQMSLFDG